MTGRRRRWACPPWTGPPSQAREVGPCGAGVTLPVLTARSLQGRAAVLRGRLPRQVRHPLRRLREVHHGPRAGGRSCPAGAGLHLPLQGRQGPPGGPQSCVLVQEPVPRAFATLSSHLCQGTPGSAYCLLQAAFPVTSLPSAWIELERWEGREVPGAALGVRMGNPRPGGCGVSSGGRMVAPEGGDRWAPGTQSASGAGSPGCCLCGGDLGVSPCGNSMCHTLS